MGLKKTERLIDAVKVIDLLEAMEGKETELSIMSNPETEEWKLKCELEGQNVINRQSKCLGDLAVATLKLIK